MGVIVLAHLYFKLFLPDLQLYGDEPYSVFISQYDLSKLINTLNNEANPPLFYILLHCWIDLFGLENMAVKGLPVLFSIGSAAVLILFGKKYLGKTGTIAISLIYLFSNLYFDFSHEIRAFSLVCFLVLSSFYLFLRLLESPKNKILLIAYVLINAAIPYTHYNAVLAVIIQFLALSLFYFKNFKDHLLIYSGYFVSLLLFIPQLNFFFNNIPDENFWLDFPGLNDLSYVFLKIVGNDIWYWQIMSIYVITTLLVFLPIRKRVYDNNLNLKYVSLFSMWFILSILINYFIAQFTPAFRLRYVLFASFGLYIQMIYCISHLNFRIIKWALSLALIYFFYDVFSPEDRKVENWQNVISILNQERTENTAVLISAGYKYTDFAYYFDKEIFKSKDNAVVFLNRKDIFPINDTNNLNNIEGIDDYEKVMLVLSHNRVVDPNNLVTEYFFDSDKWKYCERFGANIGAKVFKFIKPEDSCFNLSFEDSTRIKIDCNTWDVKKYTSGDAQQSKVQYNLNFEKENLCEHAKFMTTKGIKVSRENPYSPTLKIPSTSIQKINVTSKLVGDASSNTRFIVVLNRDEKQVLYEQYELKDITMPNNYEVLNIQFSAWFDPELRKDAKLFVYLWNPGDVETYISDFSILVENELVN